MRTIKFLKAFFLIKNLFLTKVDYVYPKYLTDDNGKVAYVCDANTFSGSVSPMEAGTTDVKYSAYKGTAYFIEAENAINQTKAESANYSSGAAMRGFNKKMWICLQFLKPEFIVCLMLFVVIM